MSDTWLLVFYLLLALGVSTLCSLVEAGILSLSRADVTRLEKTGRRSGRWLEEQKRNVDRPLSAILTLNTIAHTVGAAGVGAQAMKIFGEESVAITSAILTVLILVVSEIIPKTLGAVYASKLAVFTAYTVQGMIILTYPLVLVFQRLAGMLGGGGGHHRLTREEVAILAELGQEEGAIHEREGRVIMNLLQLDHMSVEKIMTPRNVVFMLQQNTSIEQVLEDSTRLRFQRTPVFNEGPDDIVGLVLRNRIYECLRDGEQKKKLSEIMHPLHAVPETTSVGQALRLFVDRREQFFLVVDEYGGTAGIITLEDAVETLLGVEIVDETDAVEDMRKLAVRLFKGKIEDAK